MSGTQKAPDLSAWLTKQQAADILQVSTKSIEKFAADEKLQAAKRKQPGRPDAAIYHPDDVERLRVEREHEYAPFAVARLPEKFENPSPTASQTGLETLAEVLRLRFEKPAETLFVTLKEASAITGLTQVYLRERLRNGELGGVQDGRRLRIRRKDLEGL